MIFLTSYTKFSKSEIREINKLTYKPELKPIYQILRMYLEWADECPNPCNMRLYDKLIVLWIARAFFYHDINYPMPVLNKTERYYRKTWDKAIEQDINWPGFKRLSLSEAERKFYFECLEKEW